MSDESSSTNKKHRVIAWKPEDAAINPTTQRRFPRWVVITGGCLLVLLTIRTAVVMYQEFGPGRSAGTELPTANDAPASISQLFQDRSAAEFARTEAMRAYDLVAKAPTDHQSIIQRLVTIERMRDAAEKALDGRNFVAARARFEAVTKEARGLSESLEDRRKAREGYNRFVADTIRLEPFTYLDEASYERATIAAGASQTFLDQGNFTLAREKIDEAIANLGGLEKSLVEELEANLAIGRAALMHGDGYAAKIAFERALVLQPKNELAQKSLERAEKIEQVFALQKAAAELEAAGQFEEAQKNFEKAFALDAQSATAQAGVSRVKVSIKKRDFANALARAQDALTNRKWSEAITGFEDALKVYPDDEAVQKQLAEARVQQREHRVQDMLAEAYAFEREYDWASAKRKYLELVAYQPGQTDAEQGLLRTGKVIRALLVFEKKIEEARSQAQRAYFQLAIAAFNEAMASKPSYLELSPDQAQLKATLERQSKPVQVTFLSDSRTYVTIAGVRMLGNKFTSVTVPLLPGNYDVIGRRKGYEEVRESIRVRADDPPTPVTIIANKRI